MNIVFFQINKKYHAIGYTYLSSNNVKPLLVVKLQEN